MSDLKNIIKDLLGAAVQVEFFVPFDDNSTFDYSANFSQSKFAFGLQGDHTLRTGLTVQPPLSQDIKIFSSFKSQLSFFSINSYGKIDSGLRLRILPSEVLALRAQLPDISFPLTDIVFAPVNKQEVENEMKKILQSKGLSGSEIQTKIANFFKGEGTDIYVSPGDCIGKAESTSISGSTDFRMTFIDTVGAEINPLYVLWLLWNLSKKNQITYKPGSHHLIQSLSLPNLSLAINKDDMVLDQTGGSLLGPYRILY